MEPQVKTGCTVHCTYSIGILQQDSSPTWESSLGCALCWLGLIAKQQEQYILIPKVAEAVTKSTTQATQFKNNNKFTKQHNIKK